MAVCHSVFLCLSVSLTLSLRRIEILICKNWVALLSRSNFLSTRKCCHHLCHDRPKIRCDFCKHVVNFTSTRSFECSPKSLNVTGPKLKATLYDWDRSDLHCIQSSKVIREPIPFEIVFFLFFLIHRLSTRKHEHVINSQLTRESILLNIDRQKTYLFNFKCISDRFQVTQYIILELVFISF